MAGAFSGRFWTRLGGLIVVAVVAQVLWAALAWNSSGPLERPPFAPRPPGKAPAPPPPAPSPPNRRQISNAFPPMVGFAIESAEAVGPSIADAEYVLGVEIGGESRAYPTNMMGSTGNEILNDTLGGRPIAVTFCSICEAPLVYSRQVEDRVLTFHITGELQDSNMVMGDQETRSKWLQLLGTSVAGPLDGKSLKRLPSTWVNWKTWRDGHPGTTAIKLGRNTNKYSPVIPGTSLLKKPEFVDNLQWGLSAEGGANSWPVAGLARERVVNDSFEGRPLLIVQDPSWPGPAVFDRRLGEETLTFRREGDGLIDGSTGSTWDPSTGRATAGPLQGRRLDPISGTVATTAIWRKFHPQGSVWEPTESDRKLKPNGG